LEIPDLLERLGKLVEQVTWVYKALRDPLVQMAQLDHKESLVSPVLEVILDRRVNLVYQELEVCLDHWAKVEQLVQEELLDLRDLLAYKETLVNLVGQVFPDLRVIQVIVGLLVLSALLE